MAQEPTSAVALVNIALGNLGVPRISSIETPTNQVAEICASRYPLARTCFIRTTVWNFAKRRANIARTSTPAFDWTDAYLLPADCERVLSVEGDIERWQTTEYDIEGREILLNAGAAESVKLRYIADVEDLALWSSDAKEAFSWLMTSYLAYPLTRSKEVAAWAESMLQRSLPDAKSIDGQERPPIIIEESRSILERMTTGTLGTAGPWTIID